MRGDRLAVVCQDGQRHAGRVWMPRGVLTDDRVIGLLGESGPLFRSGVGILRRRGAPSWVRVPARMGGEMVALSSPLTAFRVAHLPGSREG